MEDICTARLTIKPLAEADRAALNGLLTNGEIKKTYMIPDFETSAALNALADKLLARAVSEAHFVRGIYLNGHLIGFLNDVETDGRAIELGYVVDPAHKNNGYMTEALGAVIPALFRRGFSTVVTGAFSENAASMRVMEKCGMRRIDREEDIAYRGATHHCLYYAISAPENGEM